MSKDIVNEMVQQMGLTPQMADQLQNQQQGGMAGYPGGGMGQGPGLPTTPEEQMRLMEAAQQPQYQQPPQQEPDYGSESDTDTESTASTESDVDLAKVGLNCPPKSMMDYVMDYLKDPLIIVVLFVILSLTQVGDIMKRFLPSLITGNSNYLLVFKALIMGVSFLISKLVIS